MLHAGTKMSAKIKYKKVLNTKITLRKIVDVLRTQSKIYDGACVRLGSKYVSETDFQTWEKLKEQQQQQKQQQ